MKRTKSMAIAFLYLSMFSMLIVHVEGETGWWTTKTSLPQPQFGFEAAVANDKAYAVGGYQGDSNFLNSNFEYNSLTDTWVTKASMPTKRTELAVVSVSNKIYAIGGSASSSGGALSTNEQYDPALDQWSAKSPMPVARNWISAGVVNNKIYVMSGSDNSGGIFSMNAVYDTSTDTWDTTKKADPQARLAYGIGVVNNKIYVIGGWIRPSAPPGEPTSLNEEYDPQTDTWTTKAPMPTARNGLAVAVVNNKIYAIGGATDFNPWTNNLNVVEEYDPSTDTWRTMQPMPTFRSLLSAVTIGKKIYALGGLGSASYLDANEAFSVQPLSTLVLTPSTGFASTTMTGQGFSPSSEVTITWDNQVIPAVPSSLITDSDGNFTALISVLTQNTPGPHTVKAVDETGIEASATFAVIDMTGPQGPKGDTVFQGLTGDSPNVQLILIALPTAVSLIALCLATIALLRKRP